MTIKKGDFIEIDYGGELDDGTVFDTSNEKVAKENDIYDDKNKYDRIIICVGESHILEGLDKHLEGKEEGKQFEVKLPPEEAFGKKDGKMIQLISTSKFTKEGINPMNGLQVNIDGMVGTVKSVSGGRTLVDFNHPLSGREVKYNVKIYKIITDDTLKVKSLIEMGLNLKDVNVKVDNGAAVVSVKANLPKEFSDKLEEHIKKLVPTIKSVEFSSDKPNHKNPPAE